MKRVQGAVEFTGNDVVLRLQETPRATLYIQVPDVVKLLDEIEAGRVKVHESRQPVLKSQLQVQVRNVQRAFLLTKNQWSTDCDDALHKWLQSAKRLRVTPPQAIGDGEVSMPAIAAAPANPPDDDVAPANQPGDDESQDTSGSTSDSSDERASCDNADEHEPEQVVESTPPATQAMLTEAERRLGEVEDEMVAVEASLREEEDNKRGRFRLRKRFRHEHVFREGRRG
jgi:hypothetical protein